jgi:hypothetical protein
MFLAIALNLASIVVLVGGWTLAVRALYKGLAALDAVRDPTPLPTSGRHPDAVPIKRAA